MPLTFIRAFRVRHYECDSYGHLNHANYLRYMQETAFDASAAAGYDRQHYDEMGHIWLIRDTDITYLQPLHADDRVKIKTYVIDFRHVRSRRMYEFSREEDGEPVARAITDWVYLNSETQNPSQIPQPMIDAFFTGGPPQDVPPRERFPRAPEPPPGVFSTSRRVEWRDIDPMQHVNNATYLTYIEDCGVQVSAAHGWPMSRLQQEGIAVVARRHRIEYRQPALLDDNLRIDTWVSDVRAASATRHYTIIRMEDDALLARAQTLWVWVDIDTGRPVRVPPQFMQDFAPNIASAG